MRKRKKLINSILTKFVKDNEVNMDITDVSGHVEPELFKYIKNKYSNNLPLTLLEFNILARAMNITMYLKMTKDNSVVLDTEISPAKNNYFKVSLKEVLINEMIIIDLYRHMFNSESEFKQMTSEMKDDTQMSFDVFNRWCEILGIDYTLDLAYKRELAFA